MAGARPDKTLERYPADLAFQRPVYVTGYSCWPRGPRVNAVEVAELART
jgi:hypothetical protein